MIPTEAQPSARLLIAVAAEAEAQAVLAGTTPAAAGLVRWRPVALSGRADLVLTGIGKVNAAACVARLLPGPYGAVLSAGVCGALPGSGLNPGASVLADVCVYADEGIVTAEGFRDCAEMGFPLGGFGGRRVPVDAGLLERWRPIVGHVGPVATVSTCSGTDGAASEVVARTGALVEAMEGAAVAHVAHALGVGAAELRVVSNTTGERARQIWDLRAALGVLARVLGQAALRW